MKKIVELIQGLYKNSILLYTLIAIVLGLVLGALILSLIGYNPFRAYYIILEGVFSRPKYVAYVIVRATPLILTGLSVAFAFRTGLFNIGAEGQFIIGATVAALVGFFVSLPAIIHIPLVIIAAVLAAAIWGGIAGILKAKFGIHEVISTIMMNWIALYLANYIVFIEGFRKPATETSYYIKQTASIVILEEWKMSEAGKEWLRGHPILQDILRTPINYGILIAIAAAVLVWFILSKTVLGYKLRAVGLNDYAAEYGGINVKKNVVISMAIAGGLSGLAGATQVMGVSKKVFILSVMENYGFNGIAVALIGYSTAIGSVFAGLLFGALEYGGTKVQPKMGVPTEIINIIIGIIVFFIAIPKLIEFLKNKVFTRKAKEGANV